MICYTACSLPSVTLFHCLILWSFVSKFKRRGLLLIYTCHRVCVCVCGCSYPRMQALWWCWRDCFSVRPLGRAQLGRHGGRFIYIGQRLRAILRFAVLRSVPLIAICVVVKVWRQRGRESCWLAFQHREQGHCWAHKHNSLETLYYFLNAIFGSWIFLLATT